MSEIPKVSPAELVEKVDTKIELVKTRSLDLSFNELLDMYEDGEFEIAPDYQRLFRWPEEKESRFIESLILEMPIPPIYVVEKEEGIYELMDGLQRMSSYLHFRGALEEKEDREKYLRLTGCDIVKELNGYTFEELPKVLQIKLKRNFIRVEVIRKGSDPKLRYYMFKRLNTGGELLSEQEIRNCTVRLLDNKFNDLIIKLSDDQNFINCISHLSDEKKEQKVDQEYVLKFFAFKNDRERYKKNIAPFITEYMERVSDASLGNEDVFNYTEEELVFRKTFAVLNSCLGENIFARLNQRDNFVSSLTPTHYDSITVGLQPYLDELNHNDEQQMEKLKEVFIMLKKDSAYLSVTGGGGKNTISYLNQRISLVEEKVGEMLNEQRENS
ncbi:DUF262 domain-containing protein [Priestia megaterium]|uniref:DUF262 domain-containing protein n=1 Tax=Priestia megaterium TaxID=1404 RepID=UPI002452DDCA|nr:DUF262 domain-containing protein [Priestia megaterium]MDH3140453.1 DUF262 domain-containing protein [Priestia megaterium]